MSGLRFVHIPVENGRGVRDITPSLVSKMSWPTRLW